MPLPHFGLSTTDPLLPLLFPLPPHAATNSDRLAATTNSVVTERPLFEPKYFPPQLVRYANTLLKRQVLFGSDYPMITPDRWLGDFERLEIDDEVRPLILKENAARLLKLGSNKGK